MNAFKSNIYKYLGGTCQYLIPLYQRTYSWEKEQCAREHFRAISGDNVKYDVVDSYDKLWELVQG